MKQPAHIKVLKGISTAACAAGERHLLKPLETLFYIKSLYVDRPMINTVQARADLAQLSKRHVKTIKRRISQLIELKFLRREVDGLHAISWDDLRQRYDIEHTKFYQIPITEHVQLEYMVKAKVFEEKQRHCEQGFYASRARESIRAEVIEEVCGAVKPAAVAEYQLDYFLKEGAGYAGDAEWALSMQYTRRDTNFLNGDLQVNYRTGSKIFGFDSYGRSKAFTGGFAKLKRSLADKGVISIQQRRIALQKGIHTTVKARKVRLGFVKWNEQAHKLELIRPDVITVVPYKHVDAVHNLKQQLNERAKQRAAA